MTITYKDGTTKKSAGSNAGPYTTFNTCDEIFKAYFEVPFFGFIPPEYYSPANIQINIQELSEGENILQNYFTLSPTNYQLNNLIINDYNNVEYIQNKEILQFYNGKKYQLSLQRKEIEKYGLEYNNINLYEYNLDGSFSREIPMANQILSNYIEINIDKVYVIKFTLDNGYAEYPFSTKLETFETVPENFNFIFEWKTSYYNLKYDLKSSIITGNRSSHHLELTSDEVSQIYK